MISFHDLPQIFLLFAIIFLKLNMFSFLQPFAGIHFSQQTINKSSLFYSVPFMSFIGDKGSCFNKQ